MLIPLLGAQSAIPVARTAIAETNAIAETLISVFFLLIFMDIDILATCKFSLFFVIPGAAGQKYASFFTVGV